MNRILLLSLLLPGLALAQKGNRKGHDNMAPVVPVSEIPPSPVLSVSESLKSFKLAPGFTIEAFAAEPLVEKPIAMDFDPSGRLWVCEMLGYMPDIDGKGEDIPQGRIVVVEDTDNDGKADKRTVFLDKLHLARAVAVYPDGILFTDDTDLRWQKRDGLKPVGKPEIAVAGWVEAGNVEHKTNGLVRNLDNWLYNAKSGKRVRRIDGKWVMDTTPFRGQWGIAHDDFGRLYHNNNSTCLFGDQVAPNLLAGNAGVNLKTQEYLQLGPNNTWPARVTPGVNRAYIAKKNGYPEDTLDPKTHKLLTTTASAGMAIYRGTNFPPDWLGRGLVGESVVNLVKVIQIDDSDGKLSGSHPFGKTEWLASTDERFRPVNLYNSPDGAVLLLDMYHGIIQDKTFMTSYLREQYLSRGLDKPATGHGRIYRVRYNSGKLEAPLDFEKLSGEELIKLLAHKNGWHRDMAQRVLVDRGDASVVPMLEKLVGVPGFSLGSINALWTLEGLGKLSPKAVSAALASKDSKVICSGLWASTKMAAKDLPAISAAILAITPTSDEVKIYLARALGPLDTPAAYARLAELIQNDGSKPFVKAAAFSGLDTREVAFKTAAGAKLTDKGLIAWLDQGAGASVAAISGDGLKGDHLASFNRGKALYSGVAACFGCHGADGAGIPNLGPPLDASEYVKESPERLARILLHGLTGPITVAGQKYTPQADMPGLAMNPSMTDENLADIATYIRHEWSNKSPQVKPAVFTKTRAETKDQAGRPYNAATLK